MEFAERTTGGLHQGIAARLIALQLNRHARILDLGCGTGALLVRLRRLGFQNLLGLDVAPPSPMPGIEFMATDLDYGNIAIESGSIDLVVAIEVFEHVENIGSLLGELARLLRPEGRILLTTPNVHSLESRIRFFLTGSLKQFDAIGDPTHVTPIVHLPFERILRRHGFAVVDLWGFPEDGSSPTSRRSLRLLAAAARFCGLKDAPAGDHLCMVLARTADEAPTADADRKRALLTAHY